LILLLGCFVGFLHFIHGVVCFQWKFDGSTPPSVLWLKFEGENQLDGTCILLLMFSSCFWGGGGVNPIVLFLRTAYRICSFVRYIYHLPHYCLFLPPFCVLLLIVSTNLIGVPFFYEGTPQKQAGRSVECPTTHYRVTSTSCELEKLLRSCTSTSSPPGELAIYHHQHHSRL